MKQTAMFVKLMYLQILSLIFCSEPKKTEKLSQTGIFMAS